MWSSNTTPGHISGENSNSKWYICPDVHSSAIYNSQDMLHLLYPFICQWTFRLLPYFDSEKAMAPHSSTLAWKIPWAEEPGRLLAMGLLRVGHDWVTPLSLFTFMHWRRKWQPTPVFLPGVSQGRRSLVGCRLWDCTELDMTEGT